MNAARKFLNDTKPFLNLTESTLSNLSTHLKSITFTDSTAVCQQHDAVQGLDIIVQGSYQVFLMDREQKKTLSETIAPNQTYGSVATLFYQGISTHTVIASAGTIIYRLPAQIFIALCENQPVVYQYFLNEYGRRMLHDKFGQNIQQQSQQVISSDFQSVDEAYFRKIDSIAYRDVMSCYDTLPVYIAAQFMAKNKLSCLFVKNQEGIIRGYITDITLRDKVIAPLGDLDAPVHYFMDNPVVTIEPKAQIYEALLLMFRTKTRYLLVQTEGKYLGVISRNKLLSEQGRSPFMFIQSVKMARNDHELKEKWKKVPEVISQLLARGIKAEMVNQIITTISDTITLRIIDKVIETLGPLPAKFIFMALGSEGRKEQTLKTDQDNAIIYEDKANEQRALVRRYFLEFARQVSEKLNTIGFSFCKGNLMAKNPKWTHSLSHWKKNYADWIHLSSQETVMNFSTFFDCRLIYGENLILQQLQAYLHETLTAPSPRFYYNMATNALQYEAPLTFFKNIKTFTLGEQKVFNIKKTMTPIVDLVRVYALKHRIFKTNTGERLLELKKLGVFKEEEYIELLQAYYYLMNLRLSRQARQITMENKPAENFIEIDSLTKIEQVTLREIFKVIEKYQKIIKVEFTNTLF